MSSDPKIPDGWRKLEPNEKIEFGDIEYFGSVWFVATACDLVESRFILHRIIPTPEPVKEWPCEHMALRKCVMYSRKWPLKGDDMEFHWTATAGTLIYEDIYDKFLFCPVCGAKRPATKPEQKIAEEEFQKLLNVVEFENFQPYIAKRLRQLHAKAVAEAVLAELDKEAK